MRFFHFQTRIFGHVLGCDGVILGQTLKVIFDLDAHYQVRPAFKIESEMNIFGQSRFDARVGEVFEVRPAPVRSNYDVQAGQGDNPDDDRTLKEIFLLHELLGAARFSRINAGHRRARDLQDRFVGASDQKAGIAHRRDRADDSAGGNDFVAGFQLGDCRLQLALLFLLRPDQQQIEHAEDQNHWQHRATQAADALKKH